MYQKWNYKPEAQAFSQLLKEEENQIFTPITSYFFSSFHPDPNCAIYTHYTTY